MRLEIKSLLSKESQSILKNVALRNGGICISDLNPEIKCSTCGDKLGWHHANMKWQGKTLVCFGIGCKCEGFKL